MCSPFYYKNLHGTCIMYNFNESFDQNEKLSISYSNTFVCANGSIINRAFVNDLVPDCSLEGEDENKLITILTTDINFDCDYKYQIPCQKRHSRCYNVSQICKFKLSKIRLLLPCRTDEHLQNCADFECNMMFKCPKHYCIPWAYVCDGKWDCPQGADELINCQVGRACKNMFKCGLSEICIHIGDICDDNFDCPLGDDETFCSLHNQNCPFNCQCLTFAVRCFTLTSINSGFLRYLPYNILIINLSTEKYIENILIRFTLLISISSKDNLKRICHILPSLSNTFIINLEENIITRIKQYCFKNSAKLKLINLSKNLISYIELKAFSNLTALNYINLKTNCLKEMNFLIIMDCLNLLFILLDQNNFTNIIQQTEQIIKLLTVLTDDYRLCCVLSSNVKCLTKVPWYKSCGDLLSSSALKLSFYVTSSLIILFNIFSIIMQYISHKGGQERRGTFEILVASINISDLICGVYVIIVLISDLVYSDNFVVKESNWHSSLPCFIVFYFTLYFTLLSPVLLCLFSLSRLMVVMYPLHSKFKDTKYVLHCIFTIYTVVFVLTTSITIVVWLFHGSAPFILCSPFVNPTEKTFLLEIITYMIALIHCFSVIFIVSTCYMLIKQLNKSQKALKDVKTQKLSKITFVVQVLILIISPVICWIPSDIIYIMSIALHTFPIDMVVWTNINITTINSIIYPLVFVITTFKKISCGKYILY